MGDNNVNIEFTGGGSAAIAESKKVVDGIDGVRASAKLAGEEGSEHLSLLQETLGEISALVSEVGAEFQALGREVSAGVGKEVQSTEDRIKATAGAVGHYIEGNVEKVAAATFAYYKWGVEGAAAVGLIFSVITQLTIAYKGLSFAIGLLNGDSYKSANIDALIATNKEVMELQQLLHLSAVDAGALNDALRRLGVNKADISAVESGVKSAPGNNSDELDRLGVTYKGAGGVLLGNTTIVQNAKATLDQYTEGWDRNQAAVALGIGSYEQITNYLKVNQQELRNSKDRLDEYNLGIGPETQAAVAAYQDAMRQFSNEQELMSEGFSRAIADNIMPALTDLALFFKDGWPDVVNAFRYTMASITSLLYGLKMAAEITIEPIMGMVEALGDVLLGVGVSAIYALAGEFDKAKDFLVQSWNDARNKLNQVDQDIVKDAQHNAAAMKLAWGFDDRTDASAGRPKKGKSFVAKPDKDPETDANDDASNAAYLQQLHASHVAYASYVKAFWEEQAALVKASNAEIEELNKESYAWGLTDLQTYLDTKHKLNEDALQADVDSKLKALSAAGGVYEEALAAKKKDPTVTAQKDVYEADAKVLDAIKAVTEAQSKLTIAKLTDADETHAMTDDQLRGYREIQAQMLDMQGKYASAALIRKDLDESSKQRQALITEAMKGTAEAEAAYWAQEALDQQKSNDAVKKTAAERASITISEINNQLTLVDTAEKFYQITTSAAAQQRIVLLQQELLAQKAIYDSIQGNEPAAITARLQAQAAIDRINEKLLAQQKILSDRTAIGGAIGALHDYATAATNIGAQVNSAITGMFKGMEDALTNFITKGKLDFKSFADSIISDLVRIAIQQNVTGPIAAGVGGFLQSMFTTPPAAQSSFGSAASFGSGYSAPAVMPKFSLMPSAAGGFDIPAGTNPVTQLHEQEMVLPAQYADVIRKMATGGGAAAGGNNVQVNVINPPGQQNEVASQNVRFDADQMIVDVVLRKYKSDPGFRAGLTPEGYL